MNKTDANFRTWRSSPRRLAAAALTVALATLLSGCFLTTAKRDIDAGRGVPWWCQGTPDLATQDCYDFSASLDIAVVNHAHNYPTVADVTGAGGAAVPGFSLVGMGTPYILGDTTAFNPNVPNVFFYEDSLPASRIVAVGWAVDDNGSAPAGFAGDREHWQLDAGKYWQPVWVLRGFQNHPDVFATAHPCLAGGTNILTSTSDACFTASHTEAFEVMVTNDDGIKAGGIDAVVNGLVAAGFDVKVVAPALNQSGSGDQLSLFSEVSGSADTTLTGVAGTAVYSTSPNPQRNGSGSPADAVRYGLRNLALTPDLVVSGTNQGQNMGEAVSLSGTVDAARYAKRGGSDSIATSTGLASPPDYATAVVATLALVEQYRLGLAGAPFMEVPNINIPSCSAGTVRGTLDTVVAPSNSGRNYLLQDCLSTKAIGEIFDDIDAFNNGFIGIADVGKNTPPNWP